MKPSLFKNELLATSDPLYAWIFEGLWCVADREGRLEDRPRKIHLEINAGRAYEGTENALNWLAENEFILRYQHGNIRYIQVIRFGKHQNPHVREPASSIPAPDKPGAGTVLASDEHQSGPALSPFPLPDSPSLNPLPNGRDAMASESVHPENDPKRTNGKGKPRGHLVPFPEDFALSDTMREQALKRHPDADVEQWFELFRAHHMAHGKAMKSWTSAWVTWIGNGSQFGYPRRKEAARATRGLPTLNG